MKHQLWPMILWMLMMHLALLSLLFAPVNWCFLISAEASAFVVFGLLGLVGGRQRRRLWILAVPLLVGVHQWAWHEWGAGVASSWWPHLRYASLQLVVLLFCKVFLWRDATPSR
jgi:energy-coupling factor transporter transmembrane protein EcfT